MEIEGLEKKTTKRGSITYWKDGEIKLKQCAKCKEIKSVENFSRRGNGYVYRCKECEKQYYKDNIEQKREHSRQYARINKEYYRQYREANKDKKEEYNKQYYEANKEKQKEYAKQWREDNTERAKEYGKQWRENNPEYGKQHRKNNKDKNIRRIIQLLIEIKPIFTRLKLPVYGTIYKISNVKTGKVYIGQTIQPLKERYGKDILKGWIKERRKKQSQKFLEELIEDDFEVIEVFDVGCCKYHLNALESYYINKYNSCDGGYNNYYGNHISEDGIEEFKQILKENNLQFADGDLVNE